MFEDLTLDPEDEGKPAAGPALYSSPRMGPSELMAYQWMWLHAPIGANKIMFTEVDEATGVEIWAVPGPPSYIDEQALWTAIMKWPRPPTIEEARAWQNNVRVGLIAEHWAFLAAARAEDEARRPGDFSRKATGAFIGVPDPYIPEPVR
jgi:hypothetical protein